MATSAATADRRNLVFRVGAELYDIDANKVLEVIRTPAITRVPHGFEALAGIANLRGMPLPVIALGKLLDRSGAEGSGQRVVVYDHGEPVGLLVDDVMQFGVADGLDRLQTVDIEGLLRAAMVPSTRLRTGLQRSLATAAHASVSAPVEQVQTLLTFRLAGQTFGLALESVYEILAWPEDLAFVAGGKSLLGMTASRDSALPIFSLAALLGLPAFASEPGRIVVVDYQGDRVGLAVEQMDAIRRLPDSAIDPLPPVLALSAASPAEIEAIGRVDRGRTLISILSAQKLFGNQAVEHVVNSSGGEKQMPIEAADTAFERFLIFTLGDERYGLPIDAVDEVIRLPDSITRMPTAPAFVTGVINLRGQAVPLIDQRLRFEAGDSDAAAKPRAIVVTIDQLRAGFIVDGVSEVVAIPVSALSAAPDFSSEQAAVFDRVAHIEADGRMILLVDPRELLTRAERDVVSALAEPASVMLS
ncbi:MAG: chemotaxis protein CheW [Rhizobium sp.]